MLKALFVDYYGTVAYEMGPGAKEIVRRVYKTGNAGSPEEITKYWWTTFRQLLVTANGEDFRTQHDVALDTLQSMTEHFSSEEEPEKLLMLMEQNWSEAPLYADAEAFMDSAPYPVYFVTNIDDKYIMANIERHHLQPAGIITSEQAKYSKPRKELFLYALEKLDLCCDEVVHIGDSMSGDVQCPNSVGIQAIWLNREGHEVPDGIVSAKDLPETLEIINHHAV